MKKLLLLLGLIPALANAADTAISGLGAVSTVPDTYVTVWANSGVSNVKITFLNLTNQILAGYAGQAYALSVAATAAHDATNTFPWGVLYDPANAAHNATNGFPWGVLYDITGAGTTAAFNATNSFPWMTLNLITNTFSGGPTLHASVDGNATTATSANNSTNFWGQLSPTNWNNGTGASASTYAKGDGTWGTPSGGNATATYTIGSAFSPSSMTANSVKYFPISVYFASSPNSFSGGAAPIGFTAPYTATNPCFFMNNQFPVTTNFTFRIYSNAVNTGILLTLLGNGTALNVTNDSSQGFYVGGTATTNLFAVQVSNNVGSTVTAPSFAWTVQIVK